MKKLTTDEFIKKAKATHGNKYDYSKTDYKNQKTDVIIICPKHGEFLQKPGNHYMGAGCPACSGNKKSSNDTFIEKAKTIHGDKYDYSKVVYKNTKTKVIIVCPEHGEFLQSPEKHLLGRGCQECGKTKFKQTNLDKYGVEYPLQSEEIKQHMQETNLQRYGVKNVMELDEVKDKLIQTNLDRYGSEYSVTTDSVRAKIKASLNERYGVSSPFESEAIQQRAHESICEKYGVDNVMQNDEIKQKAINTNLERYGVEYPLQSTEIRNKIIDTNLDKYGVEYPLQSSIIQQKIKDTINDKYGVQNVMHLQDTRDRIKNTNLERYGVEYGLQSEEVKTKVADTKRKNNTFHTSKPEERLYNLLINQFGEDDVLRQYRSDEYPFNCDFYIKSADTYIELNAFWSHQGHFFNENDELDIKKLEMLKAKAIASLFYRSVVHTWTVSDVRKYNMAIQNNLNYVVFWDNSLTDARKWLSKQKGK